MAGSVAPAVAPATTSATSGPNADWLNNLIPGYSNLVSDAGGVIGNLLTGSPSPSVARNAAATFGAANGQGPGSGIADRWGYDLYNTMGQQKEQQGLSDLGSLIGSTSQPALSQESIANNLSLGQAANANQAQSIEQQGFMDQINALIGLHGAGFGSTGGTGTSGGGGNPFANLGSAVGQFNSYMPSTSSYAYL